MHLASPRGAAAATVALLAVAANWNLLENGFVYDDHFQVLTNPYIRGPGHVGEIFSTHVWSYLSTGSNYYRPLMHLIYMADYGLFGLRPAGYHATSIAFHVGCSLLLLYLGRALAGNIQADALCRDCGALFPPSCALPAALLFAAHPIHTEAVAWIAAITELSCAFFFLWSFYLYVRGHAVWSAAVALPALLAKETALVLLPLLVVYEHGFRKEARGRPYLYHLLPLGAYLTLRVWALGGLVVVANQHVLPLVSQIYSVVYLAGKYLVKMVVPAPFNLFHVFHPPTSVTDARFLGGAALVVVAAGAALWLRRRGQGLWFGVVWMLAPLVPVLYISRLGENIFTERYLYLPSVGFCWLLAALLRASGQHQRRALAGDIQADALGRDCFRPAPQRWFGAVALALLLVNYGLLTYSRNREWRDDITLFTATLRVSPESETIRNNLAGALVAAGRPESALPLWSELVRRRPASGEAHNNLGTAYALMGRHAEAREAFHRAAALRPGWALPWSNLGRLLEATGDGAAAETAYRRALVLNPGQADARNNLGVLLAEQGRWDEAEAEFHAAGSHINLGKLYLRRGQKAEAEAQFRRAVAENVNAAEAWYLLGKLQQESGRVEEGARSFREARRLWSRGEGQGWPPDWGAGFGYNGRSTRR